MTMEVEKCDDLLFAVWRSKRATGVLPVQTKGLRAHGAKGVTLSSGLKGQKWNTDVRGQETGCPRSAESEWSFLPTFSALHALNKLDDAPGTGQGILYSASRCER